MGSIPRLGRSPEEGKGYPLQYSGLENSIDCIVHGVAKSQTVERLSQTRWELSLGENRYMYIFLDRGAWQAMTEDTPIYTYTRKDG